MSTDTKPDPQSDENIGGRTRWVGAALLVLTASFILVKTGRDALYFQGRGLFDLPYAYFGITIASVPMAMGTLELMRRLGPRTARLVLPMLAAVALLIYVPFASEGGGVVNTLFFVLVPTVWGVLFSLSWLLAADLFEGRSRVVVAASYARLGASSLLGGVLGAAIARAMSGSIEPKSFVLFGAAGLVLASSIMAAAQGSFLAPTISGKEIRPEARQEPKIGLADYKATLTGPYSSILLAIAWAAALTGVFVEFQFYLAAATSGSDGQTNAGFFANFYLALNGGALFVQLVIMPRLQRWVGVHGSLLALPLVLLGGAVALIFVGGSAGIRSGIRVAEGGIKSSIHRANWEQAYLPLGQARRSTAKIIIDGMGARFGEALAAVLLLVWLRVWVGQNPIVGIDITWVSWTLGLAALTWIFLTRRLGRRLVEQAAADDADAEAFRVAIPLPDT